MKKLVIIIFLFSAGYTYAQVEKGDVTASFNISYTSFDGTGFANLTAKAGYYITNNIEIGATPMIMLGDGFSQTSLGVYGTYNFFTADAKLLPYAGASLGLVFSSFKMPSFGGGEEKITDSDASFGVYGGAKYFITEKLFGDGNLNISGSGLGTIVSVNIGVGFIIGKLK